MKIVNVSLLEVRKKPSIPSKTRIKRGTILHIAGPPTIYKGDTWVLAENLEKPIVKGYVNNKYLSNIYEKEAR